MNVLFCTGSKKIAKQLDKYCLNIENVCYEHFPEYNFIRLLCLNICFVKEQVVCII